MKFIGKEALHSLYCVKGYDRAARVFTRLTDQMASSLLPEIQTLRGSLMKWRFEILTYFASGLESFRSCEQESVHLSPPELTRFPAILDTIWTQFAETLWTRNLE